MLSAVVIFKKTIDRHFQCLEYYRVHKIKVIGTPKGFVIYNIKTKSLGLVYAVNSKLAIVGSVVSTYKHSGAQIELVKELRDKDVNLQHIGYVLPLHVTQYVDEPLEVFVGRTDPQEIHLQSNNSCTTIHILYFIHFIGLKAISQLAIRFNEIRN